MEITEGGESSLRIDVDLEKGAEYQVHNPELVESLLTPQEKEHRILAAASTPLIFSQKVIVSLVVVGFVLVEAYFVGVSFRGLIEERHKLPPRLLPPPGPLTPLAPLGSLEFGLVPWGKLVPSSSGAVKDISTPEPVEDFEGGLNFHSEAAENKEIVLDLSTTQSDDAITNLTMPMAMEDSTESRSTLPEEKSLLSANGD